MKLTESIKKCVLENILRIMVDKRHKHQLLCDRERLADVHTLAHCYVIERLADVHQHSPLLLVFTKMFINGFIRLRVYSTLLKKRLQQPREHHQ